VSRERSLVDLAQLHRVAPTSVNSDGSRQWHALRLLQLAEEPMCRYCTRLGRYTKAHAGRSHPPAPWAGQFVLQSAQPSEPVRLMPLDTQAGQRAPRSRCRHRPRRATTLASPSLEPAAAGWGKCACRLKGGVAKIFERARSGHDGCRCNSLEFPCKL
jgi:hypothetical protein